VNGIFNILTIRGMAFLLLYCQDVLEKEISTKEESPASWNIRVLVPSSKDKRRRNVRALAYRAVDDVHALIVRALRIRDFLLARVRDSTRAAKRRKFSATGKITEFYSAMLSCTYFSLHLNRFRLDHIFLFTEEDALRRILQTGESLEMWSSDFSIRAINTLHANSFRDRIVSAIMWNVNV